MIEVELTWFEKNFLVKLLYDIQHNEQDVS